TFPRTHAIKVGVERVGKLAAYFIVAGNRPRRLVKQGTVAVQELGPGSFVSRRTATGQGQLFDPEGFKELADFRLRRGRGQVFNRCLAQASCKRFRRQAIPYRTAPAE